MATLQTPEPPSPSSERERDLGFGTSLSRRTNLRLLNRDGSFNVKRRSPGLWAKLFSYNALITMAWWRFFLVILGVYFLINAAFAVAYRLCGPAALQGNAGVPYFMRAFFFSVHTFATIGYGNIVPLGIAANTLVTFESLVGLTAFALVAGLVFGRFSRPTAKIIYSKNALIAPYNGGRAFQFRIMNGRDNELLEVHASVVLGRFEENSGTRIRRFYPLNLERQRVAFFPLNWTIVHPIDETSPLYQWDEQMLRRSEAEFLILLSATDDTFAQTVHNRGSYTWDEIVWGARFLPMVDEGLSGVPAVRLDRFDQFEIVA